MAPGWGLACETPAGDRPDSASPEAGSREQRAGRRAAVRPSVFAPFAICSRHLLHDIYAFCDTSSLPTTNGGLTAGGLGRYWGLPSVWEPARARRMPPGPGVCPRASGCWTTSGDCPQSGNRLVRDGCSQGPGSAPGPVVGGPGTVPLLGTALSLGTGSCETDAPRARGLPPGQRLLDHFWGLPSVWEPARARRLLPGPGVCPRASGRWPRYSAKADRPGGRLPALGGRDRRRGSPL